MTTEVIAIAAVMIGAALVLRLYLDNRDRKRAEEMARMRGERVASVSMTPTYADAYGAMLASKDRGRARYLDESFEYLGRLDMASDLQRLPAPEQPKTAAPTVAPNAAPGQ